jgi:hypothetical protein
MPSSDLDLTKWTPGKKQLFRFFFIFFLLYIFINPNDIIPYSYILHKIYRQPCAELIAWLANDVLHINIPVTINTTADTTFNYFTLLFIFCIAGIGSVIWMFLDRKSFNYNKLYHFLIIVLRYYLAITWIAYGSIKIIRLQFPELTPVMLLQTYGNSSPRGLAWAFMGYSTGYNYFIGFTEYAIGLLLFFRRTSTLGILLSFGALMNIMAFNYCFDDNVKLLSTLLMVMTLFLLSKDIRRLIDFFFLNKVIYPENTPSYHFKQKWKNTTLLILKCGFILYLLVFDLYGFSSGAKQYGVGIKKPPLYGIYSVQTFIRNKDTIEPLITNNTSWGKLIVSSIPGNASVMLANDSLKYFIFKTDTIKKAIEMYAEKDGSDKYTFNYSIVNDSTLILNGKWRSDSLQIQLQQYDLNKFPLINQKFHWIIDHQIKIKR